jgi:hypothetical protein
MMALTSARTSACSKGVRSEGFAASIHGASASRIDSSQDDHRRHLLGQERHQSGSAYPTSAHSLRDHAECSRPPQARECHPLRTDHLGREEGFWKSGRAKFGQSGSCLPSGRIKFLRGP